MLLDEPSLGLSPKLVKEIFGILNKLNKDQGLTILLVEQNTHMALQTADRGYVMELGNVVISGDAQKLQQNPKLEQAYLGES